MESENLDYIKAQLSKKELIFFYNFPEIQIFTSFPFQCLGREVIQVA